MNICIIPARGGSTRIPRKNIKPFHGKPIISYSIETAVESKLFDKIIVSTEDDEIAEISFKYGADVLHRPPSLAQDNIGTQEVMRYELAYLTNDGQADCDYACCIYPTAPLMQPQDLKDGFRILKENELEYIHSVDKNKQDAGQWYFGRTQAFIEGKPLLDSPQSWKLMIPSDRVCDINTMDDWERAEKMYEVLK